MRSRFLWLAASAVVLSAQGVPQYAHAQDSNPFQTVSEVEIIYAGAPIIPAGAASSDEVDVYVVMMKDEPVATYRGGHDDLAPATRGRGNRPELGGENARNYRAHLRGKQASFVRNSAERLARTPEVVHSYTEALNGVAVRISGVEARALARDPAVAAIIRSENHAPVTYAGPSWIGADGVWSGPAGLQTEGEGTIVGIIDTGVNPTSPSFAATDPTDGYVHTNPYGSGNFVGVCNPAHPNHQPDYGCNDKLIGAYYFLNAWGTFPNLGAFDENGHGSHVGSTAAGNKVTINFNGADANLSGVAPRANVISYRVCGGPSTLCNTADSAAAIDQAILDGVDVLNFSIGGGTNPGADLASLAFLRATDAGVFVAAAAGNFNPNSPGTVSHRGGWMTTVASVSHNGIFAHPVSVTGPAPIAGAPQDLGGLRGTGPAVPDIGFTTVGTGSQGKGQGQQYGQGQGLDAGKVEYRWAGDVAPGNFEGCSPFPVDAFAGAVALISRGVCGFALKVDNAAAAGAVAAIIYNNANGPPIVMGAQQANTIPSVMVSNVQGQMLIDWLDAKGIGHISIGAVPQPMFADGNGDIVVLSSGRGPAGNILKPDVAAPGAAVLAAYTPNPDSYVIIGGTSMASPHVAGSGALLRALHPDWSPLEIKSALMTTGRFDGVRQPNAVTQADPQYIGGGRVNVDVAARAGLVLHETRANFEAGNAGADLSTLNLAGFANQNCDGTCTWTRTLRSTSSAGTNWAVTAASSTAGLTVSVPSSLSVAAGGTVSLSVAANTSGMPVNTWGFFEVVLSDTAGQLPDQRFSGAARKPAPMQQGSYVVASNATDATCAAPFANQGGYVNLAAFGIGIQAGISGDTIGFTTFVSPPIWMHGLHFSEGVHFRDDGIAFLPNAGQVNAGGAPWINRPIPSSLQPNNLLAPAWHDWQIVADVANDRGVRLATVGTTWLIADFRRVAEFGSTAPALSYQIAMRRNPSLTPGLWDIVFAYNHVTSSAHLSNTTIGLENLFGDKGVQVAYNDANLGQITNGRAICFRWVPAP